MIDLQYTHWFLESNICHFQFLKNDEVSVVHTKQKWSNEKTRMNKTNKEINK